MVLCLLSLHQQTYQHVGRVVPCFSQHFFARAMFRCHKSSNDIVWFISFFQAVESRSRLFLVLAPSLFTCLSICSMTYGWIQRLIRSLTVTLQVLRIELYCRRPFMFQDRALLILMRQTFATASIDWSNLHRSKKKVVFRTCG